ncbi:hypothetical protein ACP70R_042874 [Stipagrostis hirtigluma subsp. patula]
MAGRRPHLAALAWLAVALLLAATTGGLCRNCPSTGPPAPVSPPVTPPPPPPVTPQPPPPPPPAVTPHRDTLSATPSTLLSAIPSLLSSAAELRAAWRLPRPRSAVTHRATILIALARRPVDIVPLKSPTTAYM